MKEEVDDIPVWDASLFTRKYHRDNSHTHTYIHNCTQNARTLAVHPRVQAPKHTQSRHPHITLGFTRMTRDIHVGNNKDACIPTHIYTQNQPTLSPGVACSKHHQPHKPHMLGWRIALIHTNTHTQPFFSECNLRKAAFIYQLSSVLFILFLWTSRLLIAFPVKYIIFFSLSLFFLSLALNNSTLVK